MTTKRRKGEIGLEDASPAFARMCWILTVLMLVLLAVIPWSEQYSNLDNFPHGQDTELNLLAFLLILGIILLFARSCAEALTDILSACYSLLFILRPDPALIPNSSLGVVLSIPHSPPIPGTPIDAFNLPLLI